MRALRFHNAMDLRVDEVDRPECGPDQVRLKIAYCGICGTDTHEYTAGPIVVPRKDTPHSITGASLPQILGHEFSATIIEVGGNVVGFHTGQRVCVNPAMDCRHHGLDTCEACRSGRGNICANGAFHGLNDKGGGFADEIVVKPVALVALPDNVSLKLAALAEPLAVAAHMVRIAGFEEGEDAIVLGAGPIGCFLTFLLKDAGARRVIVSEVTASRAQQAKIAGADEVINPLEVDVLATVRKSMGTGADVTFEACGLQATFDTAISCTKPGGTIFNVAIHENPVSLNMTLLTMLEKKIMSGNAYTAEDYEKVIQILGSRSNELEHFITAVVPLEDAVDGGFSELLRNKAEHNKILVEVNGEN